MDTKRIFVLGNGFDLAHYLPTAYEHFISAMKVIENSKGTESLGFDELFKDYFTEISLKDEDNPFPKTKELYLTDDLKLTTETVQKMKKKLDTNGWYQHFSNHLSNVETWIDFENEIEELLISVCNLFEFEFDENTIDYCDLNESKCSNLLDTNHPLKMNAKKVLFENERQVSEEFFRNLRLKESYFINTLRYFDIVNPT